MEVSLLIVAVLRLLHIAAAFFWFGLGAAFALGIGPTLVRSGEAGMRFVKMLLAATPIGSMLGLTAILTTLAGILLYATGSPSRFTTLGNIVLGIGAVFGLLAAAHGGTATERATKAYTEALDQYVVEGQPIPAEGAAVLQERGAKLARHARISFYIMLVALIGMASARYL